MTELAGITASGVTVVPYVGGEAWHRAAVEWWVPIAAGTSADGVVAVPILSPGESIGHPTGQAAEGVSLHADDDSVVVRAEAAGWAWLRIPWDPDWRSMSDTPIRKGGPGHLVVWLNPGVTELHWSIPLSVNVAAAATTGAAVLAVAALAIVNRRHGWETDLNRRRPAAEALGIFADTVDGWVHAAAQRARRLMDRAGRRVRS